MDGTFKTRPLLVAQLYIVHYQTGDHVVPGLFTLMERRTEADYTELFNAIKNLLPPNRQEGPQQFSLDFELAVINSFTATFPRSSPTLCFFHFGQSLWWKAQTSGIAVEYREDHNMELRQQFHAIMALVFVPIGDVRTALRDLREEIDERLDDIVDLVRRLIRAWKEARPRESCAAFSTGKLECV